MYSSRDRDYEVATFRTEGTYSDGRRPDAVAYSDDWRQDVARRDFTINALLMDPESDEILDAVGGREDLTAGVIRAVGTPERRFEEDKLRMLRAVRFAARFGFTIEPVTLAAIEQHASALSVVSKERIVAELEGILKGNAGQGFEQLTAVGLLSPALAYVPSDASARLIQRMHRYNEATDGVDLAKSIAWALTVDGLPRKAAERALRDMKLSREVIRAALYLVDALGQMMMSREFKEARVMRLAADAEAPMTEAFLVVHQGKEADLVQRFRAARADLTHRPLPPRPVITGGDLKALGMRPGRAFKDILRAVDDAVLERRVVDRDEGLAWVRQLADL